MRRRSAILLVLSFLILSLLAAPVSAGSGSELAFAIGCDGFSGTGGALQLDRDNTGQQRESFIISATDGSGNIILEPVADSFYVGTSVSWAGSAQIPWTAKPLFNPITLRIVSAAGNGLSEQLIALATGSCAGLLSYGVLPFSVGLAGFDLGVASPSVDLNTVPPRATNPVEVKDVFSGHLIVNTDNLTLRSGDGPEYTRVGIVDGGTLLIPLGHNRKFTWWYVQVGDLVGWAKAEFLVARGDLTDVPVVEAVAAELAPTTFFVYSGQGLRALPSAGALSLCTIPGNLEYSIVGRDSDSKWYQIQATCDNALVNGWVAADQGAVRNPSASFIPVTTS